jgi:hypothetical protein
MKGHLVCNVYYFSSYKKYMHSEKNNGETGIRAFFVRKFARIGSDAVLTTYYSFTI